MGQHGVVLGILIQRGRNMKGAKRVLRKSFKQKNTAPRALITDKLASLGSAKRVIMLGLEHPQHPMSIKRAENSHRTIRW